jgi:hypothetical protein
MEPRERPPAPPPNNGRATLKIALGLRSYASIAEGSEGASVGETENARSIA